MELFVSNLPPDFDENELMEIFEEFGIVEDCAIERDEESGESRGFGFVVMEDEEEALAAMDGLHKSKLRGRVLKVRESFDSVREDTRGRYTRKELRRRERPFPHIPAEE